MLLLSTLLFSQEPIHSSISSYIEYKDFTHSQQKNEGIIYGLGFDLHHNSSSYKILLEHGKTQTKQPPLEEDLSFYKLFSLYNYKFNTKLDLHFHYLSVLKDNIVITDGGNIYGIGFSYKIFQPLLFDTSYFYAKYDDFKVKQNSVKIEYKTLVKSLKIKLKATTRYIKLEDIRGNSFTSNANEYYLTTNVSLHSHYKSYHLGFGAIIGDSAFAVMDDGFKLQHHAMDITKSYSVGIGKTFQKFILRAQYITQNATEIPTNNTDVKVNILRFIVNYKF